MPKLVLIRGIPGSGKSTYAQEFKAKGFRHYENDMFMYDENGTYAWSEKRRKEAVKKCIALTRGALLNGEDVVVSNCFIKHASMNPYVALAKEAGASVDVRACFGNYQNIHGVPEDVIQSMKKEFEL